MMQKYFVQKYFFLKTNFFTKTENLIQRLIYKRGKKIKLKLFQILIKRAILFILKIYEETITFKKSH